MPISFEPIEIFLKFQKHFLSEAIGFLFKAKTRRNIFMIVPSITLVRLVIVYSNQGCKPIHLIFNNMAHETMLHIQPGSGHNCF